MRQHRRLRYLPAVATSLVAIAWLVSALASFGVEWETDSEEYNLYVDSGTLSAFHNRPDVFGNDWKFHLPRTPADVVGQFHFFVGKGQYRRLGENRDFYVWSIGCPICCILTVLLPIAVGSVNRLRFSLWMWFAWTGLIAVQVAYFLQA